MPWNFPWPIISALCFLPIATWESTDEGEPVNRTAPTVALAALVLFGSQGHQALAVDETEISPMLKGGAEFTVEGEFFTALLREQSETVGQTSRSAQWTQLLLHLGVAPGAEVYLSLPYQVKGAMSFSEVSAMALCPTDENQPEGCESQTAEGTTLVVSRDSTDALVWGPGPMVDASEVAEYALGGMGNVELGMRFAPLSQKHLGREAPGKGTFKSQATWVIDLAALLPAGDHWYQPNANGRHGVAGGATSFRVRSAVSRRLQSSEPYVSVEYTRNRAFEFIPDGGGTEAITVDPADDLSFYAGAELIPYEDELNGTRFGVDIGVGYHLRGEGVWTSGVYLPSVITEEAVEDAGGDPEDVTTAGELVRLAAQPGLRAKVALHFDIQHHLRVEAGGSLGYYLPSRVEDAYNIYYGRTLGVRYVLGVSGNF